jgi:uncharacterized protein (TIGR01244 family)
MTLPRLLLLLAPPLLLSACQGEPGPAGSEDAGTVHPHEAPLEPLQLGTLQRLHVSGGVYLSSQPSPEDLALLRERGVVTVIDQRVDAETPELDERAVVTGLGMGYHNPAFGGPVPLTDAVLDETRALLREAPRPLLIHCASANRTGAAWLAYRILDEGQAVEAALAEARTVGLRSEQYEALVLDYAKRQGSR